MLIEPLGQLSLDIFRPCSEKGEVPDLGMFKGPFGLRLHLVFCVASASLLNIYIYRCITTSS